MNFDENKNDNALNELEKLKEEASQVENEVKEADKAAADAANKENKPAEADSLEDKKMDAEESNKPLEDGGEGGEPEGGGEGGEPPVEEKKVVTKEELDARKAEFKALFDGLRSMDRKKRNRVKKFARGIRKVKDEKFADFKKHIVEVVEEYKKFKAIFDKSSAELLEGDAVKNWGLQRFIKLIYLKHNMPSKSDLDLLDAAIASDDKETIREALRTKGGFLFGRSKKGFKEFLEGMKEKVSADTWDKLVDVFDGIYLTEKCKDCNFTPSQKLRKIYCTFLKENGAVGKIQSRLDAIPAEKKKEYMTAEIIQDVLVDEMTRLIEHNASVSILKDGNDALSPATLAPMIKKFAKDSFKGHLTLDDTEMDTLVDGAIADMGDIDDDAMEMMQVDISGDKEAPKIGEISNKEATYTADELVADIPTDKYHKLFVQDVRFVYYDGKFRISNGSREIKFKITRLADIGIEKPSLTVENLYIRRHGDELSFKADDKDLAKINKDVFIAGQEFNGKDLLKLAMTDTLKDQMKLAIKDGKGIKVESELSMWAVCKDNMGNLVKVEPTTFRMHLLAAARK